MSASNIKQSIPTLIKNFMQEPLWDNKPIGQWLYEGLPDAIKISQNKYDEWLHDLLEELAKSIGTPKKKAKMADEQEIDLDSSFLDKDWVLKLSFKDGSFEQHFHDLRKAYKQGIELDTGFELFERIAQRAEGYQGTAADLIFLQNDLLPTLEELKRCDPLPRDLQVLNDACGRNPERRALGYQHILFFYNSRDYINDDLKIPDPNAKQLGIFLETLRSRVEEIVKTNKNRLNQV